MLFKKARSKKETDTWCDEYMKRLLLLSDDEFFILYSKQINHPNPTRNDDLKLKCMIQHCQIKAMEALKLHI